MIQKNIENITKKDLEFLIDNEILESRTLDYKQELNLDKLSDKKELLADISSFANTSGGDIIFGIKEMEGIPTILLGLDIAKEEIDSKTLQLENIIRHGVEPRIPNIHIKFIEVAEQKHCLIIRIEKSWTSPHWVSLDGYKKFYGRSSNGKYQLDIDELRNAFISAENLVNKIRNFRVDRISKVIGNEMPVLFQNGAKIVVHLIPLSAFSSNEHLNLEIIKKEAEKFSPLYCSGWNYRINVDGFLLHSTNNSSGLSYSYSQFYRNGIIEMVNSSMLVSLENENSYIPSERYEIEIIKALNKCVNYYINVNINTPIFISISLVGVKGYIMAINKSKYHVFDHNPIDRDVLLTQEVIIDNFNENIIKVTKPCFDFIWNACGFESSFNFDKNGEWLLGKI
jgi:hypothetical protein